MLIKLEDGALIEMYKNCGVLANKYDLPNKSTMLGYNSVVIAPAPYNTANYAWDNQVGGTNSTSTTDWRKEVDEALKKIKEKMREIGNDWKKPVFIIGISPNATAPGASVGNTSGTYIVPKSIDDPQFYAALTAVVCANIMSNNFIITGMALAGLKSVSSDYGTFTDAMSPGMGLGLSASIGVSIGVFRSIDDFVGLFNESGGSGGPGISIGADVALNMQGCLVGFTVTIGVAVRGSFFIELHSRFGTNFVYSEKQGKWLFKN
jgi:hypothetical protein